MNTYSIPYTWWPDDADEPVELELEYSVTRYYPATGPSWNDPGSPAEGGDIVDLTAYCEGQPYDLSVRQYETIVRWLYDNHDFYQDR